MAKSPEQTFGELRPGRVVDVTMAIPSERTRRGLVAVPRLLIIGFALYVFGGGLMAMGGTAIGFGVVIVIIGVIVSFIGLYRLLNALCVYLANRRA